MFSTRLAWTRRSQSSVSVNLPATEGQVVSSVSCAHGSHLNLLLAIHDNMRITRNGVEQVHVLERCASESWAHQTWARSMSGNTFRALSFEPNPVVSPRESAQQGRTNQSLSSVTWTSVPWQTWAGDMMRLAFMWLWKGFVAFKEYLVTSACATGRRNRLSRYDESTMSTGQVHNQIHIDTTLNGPT